MSLQKILLTLMALALFGCTEDLGAGKLSVLPNTPQGTPTPIPGGGGWSTKSLYQLSIGNDSVGNGGGIDSNGNWYSVGYGLSSGVKSWIVRKSIDKGVSWTVVDQFNYAPGQESVALGFAADKNGNIFVVGEGIVNLGTPQYYWLVRKSSNAGNTWTTVDSMTGAPGFYNEAAAIAVSSTNRIFVTGVTHDGTKFEWPIRTSNDGGATWTSATTYASTNHARGYGIATDTGGSVFICGAALDNNNKNHWIIAKSTNNGTNWTEVDNYQMQIDGDAECKTLALDKSGRLFSGGFASSAANGKHWIVKRANVDGSSWLLRDDFVHPSDSTIDANSSARSIAFDSANNVYVAGFGSTFIGPQKYIAVVRKSINGGSTWTTEDAYQPQANKDEGVANSIVISSENRVFLSGGGWIGTWGWLIRGNP